MITVADHRIIGHLRQNSRFCPNIAVTPDDKQASLTLKDTGRVIVFDAHPPLAMLKSINTRPIANHVNFLRRLEGQFAGVTACELNELKVFQTKDFALVAIIPVGKLPHGISPSGDDSRVYVGQKNGSAPVSCPGFSCPGLE